MVKMKTLMIYGKLVCVFTEMGMKILTYLNGMMSVMVKSLKYKN